MGEGRIQSPVNTVLVVFGGTDSRALDRALVERFFPGVLAQGVSTGHGIWILFDHDGNVPRTGEERFESRDLRTLLETRFPGIRTVNRRRGLTSVRRPMLTMGGCSNLQILIEKCP
jgi:hypothetical protein